MLRSKTKKSIGAMIKRTTPIPTLRADWNVLINSDFAYLLSGENSLSIPACASSPSVVSFRWILLSGCPPTSLDRSCWLPVKGMFARAFLRSWLVKSCIMTGRCVIGSVTSRFLSSFWPEPASFLLFLGSCSLGGACDMPTPCPCPWRIPVSPRSGSLFERVSNIASFRCNCFEPSGSPRSDWNLPLSASSFSSMISLDVRSPAYDVVGVFGTARKRAMDRSG